MNFLLLLLQEDAAAPVKVPIAMAAHTWFVILAVGAFLIWSVSYSLQLQKEAFKRKKGREELVHKKEALLDRIADLEDQREAGKVTERKYKEELKELKFQLSKILDKLEHRPSQS
jgi:cell division protein FtsB